MRRVADFLGLKPVLFARQLRAVTLSTALGLTLSFVPLAAGIESQDALIAGLCVLVGITPMLVLAALLATVVADRRFARAAVTPAGSRCHACGHVVIDHPRVHGCPECGSAGSAVDLARGWRSA